MNRTELNQLMANGRVFDLEVSGVDRSDFPDFCDAYFSDGLVHIDREGLRPLTDTELEWLTEDCGEKLNEMAHERCRDAAISRAEILSDR